MIMTKCAAWEVRVAVFEDSPEAEEEVEAEEEDEAGETPEVCREVYALKLFL